MLTALALQILCLFWGLSDDYIAEVKKFIVGSEWDDNDDVRLQCIGIAGEYLKSKEDNELLIRLINIYEDTSDFESVRGSAYFALARAQGKNWDELPPTTRILDFDKDIDKDIIDSVRKRAFGK